MIVPSLFQATAAPKLNQAGNGDVTPIGDSANKKRKRVEQDYVDDILRMKNNLKELERQLAERPAQRQLAEVYNVKEAYIQLLNEPAVSAAAKRSNQTIPVSQMRCSFRQ